jgi:hypothetical protein
MLRVAQGVSGRASAAWEKQGPWGFGRPGPGLGSLRLGIGSDVKPQCPWRPRLRFPAPAWASAAPPPAGQIGAQWQPAGRSLWPAGPSRPVAPSKVNLASGSLELYRSELRY